MFDKDKELYIFKAFFTNEIVAKPCNGVVWPVPRSGHRILWGGDNKLYLLGGFNPIVNETLMNRQASWSPDNPIFKEVFTWNPLIHKSWKRLHLSIIPQQLVSFSALCHLNTILVFGGSGWPFGDSNSNELWIMRLFEQNMNFQQIAATEGDVPSPVYGHAGFLHNNFYYTIGGTCGFFYNCDIHRLNLDTLKWEAVYRKQNGIDGPEGRYKHEIAFHDDKIYILGGGTSQETFDLMKLPTFDITTNLWSTTETKPDPSVRVPVGGFPGARKFFSTVQFSVGGNDYVYIMGGAGEETRHFDVWRLNLNSLSWSKMHKTILPTRLSFHSSCVTPTGCMYTFGGNRLHRGGDTERTNRLFKTWLCVPKLSEISWEAIQHYIPSLQSFSKSDLLSIGIPPDFVSRLDDG